MKKQILTGEHWQDRSLAGEVFQNILFDECTFQGMQFTDCTFANCLFKNCNLGFSCLYDRCNFERCAFSGKNSYFGDDCQFNSCTFTATVIQNGSMEGVSFADCRFSGRWQALVLFGSNTFEKPVVFTNVDLSDVQLVDVHFRCGVDLSTVTLPTSGVQVIRNPGGELTKRFRDVSATLDREARLCLRVFGNKMYERQDPLVFCERELEQFLALPEVRELFEQIVAGSEVE